MSKTRTAMYFGKKYVEIYQQTFVILKENPTVCILFAMLAMMDFLALTILFLAPAEPIASILAPIIKTFWSERFLHYPENFILLPKLFNHAHFLILSVFGIMVTGIVIKKIEAYKMRGEKLPMISAAAPVIKKYFSLLLVWLMSYGIFSTALKNLSPLLPPSLVVQLAAGFLLGLVIQSLFAFLMPALLISNKGFFKDLWQGLCFGARNLITTVLLIALPIFALALVSFSKAFTPFYVNFMPEIVLWLLVIGIIISMVVDILVTSSTTVLYLKVRKLS